MTNREPYKFLEGEISFTEWANKYKPIKNHVTPYPDPTADFESFETYGDESDFVRSQDHRNVWTWVDGDSSSVLIQGAGFVNRISYYVCEEQWSEGNDETVVVSIDHECECYDEERTDNAGELGSADCEYCEGSGIETEYVDDSSIAVESAEQEWVTAFVAQPTHFDVEHPDHGTVHVSLTPGPTMNLSPLAPKAEPDEFVVLATPENDTPEQGRSR
jgi:hypothetical protein